MSLTIIFWLLMLLWLVFGVLANWPAPLGPKLGSSLIGSFLLFAILAVVGWKLFGPPIHQ